ncbi:MAG TPA: hypothetical protein VK308_01980, partial [Pyrinomonadaceae bacterium]|nr:hypothetical protein [Pyrinomonadaceae bacterium]
MLVQISFKYDTTLMHCEDKLFNARYLGDGLRMQVTDMHRTPKVIFPMILVLLTFWDSKHMLANGSETKIFMPKFTKKSISQFLRNGCDRQFIFSLYSDVERKTHRLPPRQRVRAAPGFVAEAGDKWQNEKVSEVKDVFGAANVYVNPIMVGNRPKAIDLLTVLPLVSENQFIVEGKYGADTATFRAALGIGILKDFFGNDVVIGDTQPDIIQVLPPISKVGISSSGTFRNPYEDAVLPDGETKVLNPSDNLLRLRVIDIKLTSEPGAYYFA